MWGRCLPRYEHHAHVPNGYCENASGDTADQKQIDCGPLLDSSSATEKDVDLGEDWMARLGDKLLLSALTIPGTHDSAAFTISWPFVATQTMDVKKQLDAGIRYFDLRCGIRDDIVEMVHGRAFLGLALSDVTQAMYAWLDEHPKEALIVQIKQDRQAQRSTLDFFQAVFKLIANDSGRWRTANTTPSLSEMRGKIQLFRRYNGPRFVAFGIDVTRWWDNPTMPFTIYTRNDVQLTIQDHYSFAEATALPDLIATKGGDVARLLDRASSDPDARHWYINFTSAFEFNWYYQITPREVAAGGYWAFHWEYGMNPRVKGSLENRKGRQRLGIVPMDFPETEGGALVRALIMSNFSEAPDSNAVRQAWSVVASIMILSMALIMVGILTVVAAIRYLPT